MITQPRERPIIFSSDMVQAILNGSKTQTRRIVKPRSGPQAGFFSCHPKDLYPYAIKQKDGQWDSFFNLEDFVEAYCPYGKPGDRLWVRETWRPRSWGSDFDWMIIEFKAGGIAKEINPWEVWGEDAEVCWEALSTQCIKADCPQMGGDFILEDSNGRHPIKWRSPIFMPRAASRLSMELRSVRVERLQDISAEDIFEEGIRIFEGDRVSPPSEGKAIAEMYRDQWQKLWYQIHGKKHPWESNPWLWCLEFHRVEIT